MTRNTTLSTDTYTLPDGRTLAYTTSGASDGFPVVAHHGTPGSRLFGAVLANAAAEAGVRLLVVDRPGYGRSSPPPDGWTWSDWRSDLTNLLRAASIDRAALLGFSGGGPFALAAASSEWATRLGLVSTVVPPADIGIVQLSKIPFAVRVLFRISRAIAALGGPEMVVQQYTAQSVSDRVAQAVAADFHEAFRQDTRAVARENRSFASDSLAPTQVTTPIRAWHGTHDENTPLAPVQALMNSIDGTLETSETDHLGALLDHSTAVFRWLDAG